jgi:hypothetical protein
MPLLAGGAGFGAACGAGWGAGFGAVWDFAAGGAAGALGRDDDETPPCRDGLLEAWVGVVFDAAGGGDAVAAPPPPQAPTAKAVRGITTALATNLIGLLRVMLAPSEGEHRQSQRRAVIESRDA